MNLNPEKFIKHGIFAVLFVGLFMWTMRENAARETDLKRVIQEQNITMAKMAETINVDIKDLRDEIRDKIANR